MSVRCDRYQRDDRDDDASREVGRELGARIPAQRGGELRDEH